MILCLGFSKWIPTPEVDLTSATGMFVGVGATLQTLGFMVPGGVVTNLPDPSNTLLGIQFLIILFL